MVGWGRTYEHAFGESEHNHRDMCRLSFSVVAWEYQACWDAECVGRYRPRVNGHIL